MSEDDEILFDRLENKATAAGAMVEAYGRRYIETGDADARADALKWFGRQLDAIRAEAIAAMVDPFIIRVDPPDGYFTPLTSPAVDQAPRFSLGRIVATPGALDAIEATGDPGKAAELLARHQAGDWGTVGAEDAQANEDALDLEDPQRLLSAYLVDGARVWIITEWDRSATTILLPEEY